MSDIVVVERDRDDRAGVHIRCAADGDVWYLPLASCKAKFIRLTSAPVLTHASAVSL